jgi:hypothetical protein
MNATHSRICEIFFLQPISSNKLSYFPQCLPLHLFPFKIQQLVTIVWANSETDRDEKGCNTTEYIAYGMKEFNADDGVPITLKAMLFNRYCRGNGGGVENEKEHFKKWYQKLYPASE